MEESDWWREMYRSGCVPPASLQTKHALHKVKIQHIKYIDRTTCTAASNCAAMRQSAHCLPAGQLCVCARCQTRCLFVFIASTSASWLNIRTLQIYISIDKFPRNVTEITATETYPSPLFQSYVLINGKPSELNRILIWTPQNVMITLHALVIKTLACFATVLTVL